MARSHTAAFVCLVLICGCNLLPSRSDTRYVDPALPMSYSRNELVDYLNNQSQGLTAWRDIDMSLKVVLPNGLSQRLSGTIACQAPNHFRLTANGFMSQADFGSNSDRCWVYVRPGDAAVLTWSHEDAALLQHMPVDIPRIDPKWLMVVLGVSPLMHEDYDLSPAPTGERELWLTAIEDNYDGRPLRRVIKVDTIHGVIREHAIYDSERNPLVRAMLSEHKSTNGHVLPRVVQLKFPQMDTELRLTFSRIETGCRLPDELWRIPAIRNAEVVDLGRIVRHQIAVDPSRRSQTRTAFAESSSNGRASLISLQTPAFDKQLPQQFEAWRTLPPDPADGVAVVEDIEWDTPAVGSAAEPEWDDPVSSEFDNHSSANAPRSRWSLLR